MDQNNSASGKGLDNDEQKFTEILLRCNVTPPLLGDVIILKDAALQK